MTHRFKSDVDVHLGMRTSYESVMRNKYDTPHLTQNSYLFKKIYISLGLTFEECLALERVGGNI